jgi:serine/threonine protein kinase
MTHDLHAAGPSRGEPRLPAVPGYEILGPVGRGGLGLVLKARQQATNRTVALKMILAGEEDGAARARFLAEAEATARLSHPHIVQLFEAGEADGRPFLVCEFVPGGSLAAALDGTPWEARRAARFVLPLARALAAAHAPGIVHRDLKPSKVLLSADGSPKVADFGLAKRLDADSHTQTGAILGTPSYMAPEQAGGATGPAADVYGLGAILYELLSGRPPFKGADVLQTLDLVRTQEPVPPRVFQPKVPPDVETICLKCLQKDAKKGGGRRQPTAGHGERAAGEKRDGAGPGAAVCGQLRPHPGRPARLPRRPGPGAAGRDKAEARRAGPARLRVVLPRAAGECPQGRPPAPQPISVRPE